MRLIARYQMGWCDTEGNPARGGGKAIRPALAVLSAAGGGRAARGRGPGRGRGRTRAQLLAPARRRHGPRRRAAASPDRVGGVRRGPGDPRRDGDADRGGRGTRRAGPAGQRCLPCLLDAVQRADRRAVGGHRDGGPAAASTSATCLQHGGRQDRRAVVVRGIDRRDSRSAPRTSVVAGSRPTGSISASRSSWSTTSSAWSATPPRPASHPRRMSAPANAAHRSSRRSTPGSDARSELADLLADGPPTDDEDVALATRLDRRGGRRGLGGPGGRRPPRAGTRASRGARTPASRCGGRACDGRGLHRHPGDGC